MHFNILYYKNQVNQWKALQKKWEELTDAEKKINREANAQDLFFLLEFKIYELGSNG